MKFKEKKLKKNTPKTKSWFCEKIKDMAPITSIRSGKEDTATCHIVSKRIMIL